MPETQAEHWLDQYAAGYHAWQRTIDDAGRICFYRPLGLVERGFDLDGFGYEGRADINATLELNISTTCTPEQLHKRILLAWSSLRLHHVLLLSKAVFRQSYMRPAHNAPTRYYLIHFPESIEEVLSDAKRCLTFIEGDSESFDLATFFHHCQNVARIVKPEKKALAELFVAPLQAETGRRRRLKMLMVMGVGQGIFRTLFIHFAHV